MSPYSSGSVIASDNMDANSPGQYRSSVLALTGGEAGEGGIDRIGQVRVISNGGNRPLPNMEAWFFNTPPNPQEDGTPFAVKTRELRNLLCVVPLKNSFIGQAGANCVLQSDPAEIDISGAFRLYAILVFRGPYTPIAGEEFILNTVSVRE